MTKANSALLLLASTLIAGCADYLPFSSAQLDGTVSPLPDDWRPVATAEIIQLETQPEDPYSVNLWVLAQREHLYLFAGDNYTTWVEHIDANPNVRIKIGERIYPLVASRVTDADEFEAFAQGWQQKYGNRPRNENVDETYLLRLRARDE